MTRSPQFCEACGVKREPSAQFCEACGHRIPSGLTNYSRLRELFDQAMSIQPDQRLRWAHVACAGDESLYSELCAMLPKEQDSFLARPAELPPSMAPPATALPSAHFVGPYRVVRELGRGGMGIVYLAVRDDGAFRKNVALKLLLSEQVTAEFVQRFKQERQVLATMDHPNIARILDGGDTANGMPYYVMEYVEGTPVDKHCAEQRHGLTARIRIFQQICQAVQYLHQNSILHRDLKPSNILVSNDGQVKLLDFGIAKVVGAGSYSNADVTSIQGTPMTPNYASPEQVSGQTLKRPSDIYSLGVILYQLLTGRLPYSSWEEKQEKLAERMDPAPPSANLREDLKNSPESTAQLRRSMMGELDSIVMKTMRFDPNSRYESAADLAEDLQHFLDGQAVTAHQVGMAGRSLRLLRRKRVAIAVLCGFFLLGGFGFWQWRRVELQKAEIANQEARLKGVLAELEKRADTVKPVESVIKDLKTFKKDFIGKLPAVAAGLEPKQQKALLAQGIQYLDRLTTVHVQGLQTKADLGLELAEAYEQLGVLQASTPESVGSGQKSSIETMTKAAGILSACAASAPDHTAIADKLAQVRLRIRNLGGDPGPQPAPQTLEASRPDPTRDAPRASEPGSPLPTRTGTQKQAPPPPTLARESVASPPAPIAAASTYSPTLSPEVQDLYATVESRILVAEKSIEPLRRDLEANGQMLNPVILSNMSSMRIRLSQAKRAMTGGNEAMAREHLGAARAFSDRVLQAVGR